MKQKRQEGGSQNEWNMRQADENVRQAGKNIAEARRNMDKVVWMWKWLLIPMWSLIIILWIVRAMR